MSRQSIKGLFTALRTIFIVLGLFGMAWSVDDPIFRKPAFNLIFPFLPVTVVAGLILGEVRFRNVTYDFDKEPVLFSIFLILMTVFWIWMLYYVNVTLA